MTWINFCRRNRVACVMEKQLILMVINIVNRQNNIVILKKFLSKLKHRCTRNRSMTVVENVSKFIKFLVLYSKYKTIFLRFFNCSDSEEAVCLFILTAFSALYEIRLHICYVSFFVLIIIFIYILKFARFHRLQHHCPLHPSRWSWTTNVAPFWLPVLWCRRQNVHDWFFGQIAPYRAHLFEGLPLVC